MLDRFTDGENWEKRVSLFPIFKPIEHLSSRIFTYVAQLFFACMYCLQLACTDTTRRTEWSARHKCSTRPRQIPVRFTDGSLSIFSIAFLDLLWASTVKYERIGFQYIMSHLLLSQPRSNIKRMFGFFIPNANTLNQINETSSYYIYESSLPRSASSSTMKIVINCFRSSHVCTFRSFGMRCKRYRKSTIFPSDFFASQQFSPNK